MSRFTRFAAAALAAAAVLPATSQAATGTSSVASHLKKASTASHRLERLVAADKNASALAALTTARRETAAAARQARALARTATTPEAAEQAIWALAATGAAQGNAAGDFGALLDDVSGKLQAALAGAMPSSIASRDSIIASITALIDKFGDPELSALAAQALSALAAQTPATLQDIAAIPVDELPNRISALVQTAMQAVTGALDLVTQHLGDLIPMLPTAAQGPVGNALTTVTGIIGSLSEALPGLTTQITNSLDGVMDLVSGLLGQMPGFGGAPAGGTTGGTATVPTLGGLIPDLGKLLPGFGGLLQGLFGGVQQ